MQRHHGKRWLLVGSGIVAVCLSSAACSEPPATFDVDGKLNSTAQEVRGGNCVFADITYYNGDAVVLRGADDTLLALSHLDRGNGSRDGKPGVCDLAFHFHDIRPGDVGYQLTVGPSRRIVVSEQQLRTTDFQITPRRHTGGDEPDFGVTGATSSSQPAKP